MYKEHHVGIVVVKALLVYTVQTVQFIYKAHRANLILHI